MNRICAYFRKAACASVPRTFAAGALLVAINGAAAMPGHAEDKAKASTSSSVDVAADGYSEIESDKDLPDMPSGESQQNTRDDANVHSPFSVFGIPVKFNAPVQPSYNGDFTYTTYGGQPGRGQDTAGAWGAAGQP